VRRHTLEREIATLFPGYFALVMATGIVGVAALLLEMEGIAWVLLVFNIGAYAVLWLLTIIRLLWFFPLLLEDAIDHSRGPGYFTIVAATCVLGSQILITTAYSAVPYFLWLFGIVLWVIVMYTFFTAVVVREDKPSLEAGINGAWLIAAVATQSVSVLGTLLAPALEGAREAALLFALCMYLLGASLYLTIITLIFYRFTFLELTMERLTPPYWINMGAVAITTLAGSTLILRASEWSLLEEIVPFLKGFTLFFWSIATWWIPLLLILGVWRHVYKRYPLRYDPQYWGMVFPLGMYTVCTIRLAQALEVDLLLHIPRFFGYVALAAWLGAFLGLVGRMASILMDRATAPEEV